MVMSPYFLEQNPKFLFLLGISQREEKSLSQNSLFSSMSEC